MVSKKLKTWLSRLDWSYLGVIILAVIAAIFALTYRLSGLTGHKLAIAEQNNFAASSSLHDLLINPLFLPYKLVEWIIVHLGGWEHIFSLRLTSVIFGLLGLWLFLSIARRWFNKPTYIIATIIFGTSLWQLHFGRISLPLILYMVAPLALIRTLILVREAKMSTNKLLLAIVLALVIGLSLYVPGMWLLWLTVLIWQRKMLMKLAGKLDKTNLMAIAAGSLIILLPLIYGLAHAPDLALSWLGYSSPISGVLAGLVLIIKLPAYLFVYGPNLPPDLWLGRQPVLDAFSAAMALTGLYFYVRNFRLRQAKLLGFLLASAWALFIASNSGLLGLIVGPVYLLVAAGVGHLLLLWKKIFPRNPFAYGSAVFLLSIAMIIAVIYTTRSYYVAWHYHPETRQAFSINP